MVRQIQLIPQISQNRQISDSFAATPIRSKRARSLKSSLKSEAAQAKAGGASEVASAKSKADVQVARVAGDAKVIADKKAKEASDAKKTLATKAKAYEKLKKDPKKAGQAKKECQSSHNRCMNNRAEHREEPARPSSASRLGLNTRAHVYF